MVRGADVHTLGAAVTAEGDCDAAPMTDDGDVAEGDAGNADLALFLRDRRTIQHVIRTEICAPEWETP